MNSTKKGVASLYTVIFATILFGVITVSFVNITLSEVSQSSNDDLSRSAYDSAMAGVEDAKTAVNEYYDCVSKKGSNSSDCVKMNVFSDSSVNNCTAGFPLAYVLYGLDGTWLQQNGGVPIREVSTDTSFASNQFYTCVLIKNITPDYRGTLTADTRTKVVPLSVSRSTQDIPSALAGVSKIRFEWFSELNQGRNITFNQRPSGSATLPAKDDATTPPTIQLTLIKTPRKQVGSTVYNVDISKFNDSMNNDGEEYIDSSMLLLPTTGASSILTISKTEIVEAGNASKSATNKPFTLECTKGREFACVAELDVASLFHTGDNALLVVSLPYGDAYTDFAVTLIDGSNNQIDFEGAQISVDSTGKTDQLVRRVEVRLDPADLFFPYPQYAIEAGDDGSGVAISKYFWVTANCWRSNIPLSDGDKNGTCNQNGDSW